MFQLLGVLPLEFTEIPLQSSLPRQTANETGRHKSYDERLA